MVSGTTETPTKDPESLTLTPLSPETRSHKRIAVIAKLQAQTEGNTPDIPTPRVHVPISKGIGLQGSSIGATLRPNILFRYMDPSGYRALRASLSEKAPRYVLRTSRKDNLASFRLFIQNALEQAVA